MGNQAEFHLGHISGIAGQFFPEGAFLKHGSSCNQEHQNQPEQGPMPGSEQEGSSQHKDEDAGIHGMAHIVIWAGGDDAVPAFFLNPYYGRQVRIFTERQEKQVERGQQQRRPTA